MKIQTGQNINKEQAIKMYKLQCQFFNLGALPDWQLSEMTTRNIYNRGQRLFLSQPKHKQEAFQAMLEGKPYVRPEPNWWQKILLNMGINVDY